MSNVTIFKNIRDTTAGTHVALPQIYESIKTGFWAPKIEALRKDPTNKKLKNDLPYFTGSGTFSERKDSGLIQHSGRLVVDFDKLADLPSIKSTLCADKYSECVFTSCSGTGLAVVVKINPNRHAESFTYLEKYYKKAYGLELDKSCKDISRPRFISHDPDLFLNPNSILAEPPTRHITEPHEKYEWCLNLHKKRHEFIEGNRHHFVLVLAYFLNKVGIDKSWASHQLVADFAVDPRPDAEEIQTIVEYCYKRQATLHNTFQINKGKAQTEAEGIEVDDRDIKEVYRFAHEINKSGRPWTQTDVSNMASTYLVDIKFVEKIFKYIFDKHKDEYGIENKPEVYRILLFLKQNYDIIRNEVTLRREYKYKDEVEFRKLNSDTIYLDLMKANFKFTLDKLKSILRSDEVISFNPFREYFENLEPWDGVSHHIETLANYIKTDNQQFYETQFKKALVRSIACTLDHKENRIVFVFVGEKQETGKSTFIRFLNPFNGKYYTESPIKDNKDSEFRFAENFIYNLEELSSLNNIEINKLKAIISKSVIKERKPYAEDEEEQPRRCNFWGSTNKSEFLNDTENTRWLCFNVKSIEWGYKTAIDINKVYAQAYALYKEGFDYHLTDEERGIRESTNQNFEVRGHEHDLISMHFKVATEEDGEFLNITEIQHELLQKTGNMIKLNNIALGRSLTQLGFISSRRILNGQRVRGYFVHRYSIPSIEGINSAEARIPY